MTDAVVVYYGCQFYSSATTYLVVMVLAHLTVLYMLNKNTLGVKKVRGQSEATMVI